MLWKEILVAIKPAIINQRPFLYAKWEILDTNIYGYLCTCIHVQLYIFLGSYLNKATNPHNTHIYMLSLWKKTLWSGIKYQINRLIEVSDWLKPFMVNYLVKGSGHWEPHSYVGHQMCDFIRHTQQWISHCLLTKPSIASPVVLDQGELIMH